jgi:phosphatidylserine/phosphatidylglycerophosphate/cardiolipin synthase-like enzyme
MHTLLSTGVFGRWTVTSLRDSLLAELDKDKSSSTLKMYFYAVTNRGWTEIRKSVTRWMQIRRDRAVVIYVGTDHAITEPSALEMMQADKVNVRVMRKYQGVFHPKVVWLQGANKHIVWVGSNNLTKDGLLHNIEFAVLVRSASIPAELRKWIQAVDLGSVALTNDLLQSYRAERQEFEAKRARSKSITFTWI